MRPVHFSQGKRGGRPACRRRGRLWPVNVLGCSPPGVDAKGLDGPGEREAGCHPEAWRVRGGRRAPSTPVRAAAGGRASASAWMAGFTVRWARRAAMWRKGHGRPSLRGGLSVPALRLPNWCWTYERRSGTVVGALF